MSNFVDDHLTTRRGPSVVILGTRGYPSYYGGFETAIRELAPYLVEQGWDVTVFGRPGAVKEDDPNVNPHVRVVETRGIETKSLSTLTYGLSSALVALKQKPDVALIMNVANGFWIPFFRIANIPTLVNVDGIEWERAKWGRLARALFLTGAKFTARWADRLVVDSQEIGRRWRAEFGRDGVFIPYGGKAVHPPNPPGGMGRRQYVVMVARFVPENTVAEFFDAVPQIAEHLDVVIVGSSGYGGEFDEVARRLDAENSNVHWYGHVSDDRLLFALWHHAAVYVHGHSVGGTNPALVQAMAAGAPTVARDTVFNREVLGDNAIYFSPDSRSIVEVILRAAGDRRWQDRVAQANVQRAEKHYSWKGVCASYGDQLIALVEGNDQSRRYDPLKRLRRSKSNA